MNKVIGFFLALALVVAGMIAVWAASRDKPVVSGSQAVIDEDYPDPATIDGSGEPLLKRYTLVKQTGEPFDSEELKGNVHVVSFFFSNCPHSCLLQNQEIKKIASDFGEQGVKFLSITVDPDSDTPSRLTEYAGKLSANHDHWFFLTGDLEYIQRVGAEMYQVPVDKQLHSEKLLIHDKWGTLRGRFNWKDPQEVGALRGMLAQLIAEQKQPIAEPQTNDGPISDEDGRVGSQARPRSTTDEADPASDDPVTEDPVTEDPATEDPVTEDPATEDPATEDPVTEEPGGESPEEPKPDSDQRTAEDARLDTQAETTR